MLRALNPMSYLNEHSTIPAGATALAEGFARLHRQQQASADGPFDASQTQRAAYRALMDQARDALPAP